MWKEEEYKQNSQYIQKCAPQTHGKLKYGISIVIEQENIFRMEEIYNTKS